MNYKLNPLMHHLPNEDYILTFMRGRGFDGEEQIERYLNPNESYLHNPLLLKNIDSGVSLLKYHLDNGSKISLTVDSDQDGVTSAAIFYNYVKKINPEINIEWYMHEGKQHGVEIPKVPSDAKLIVIPDAGSNQYDEHEQLKSLGYDILVIDHHICDHESQDALVVNNQLGDYPNKDLSGAGVVYKFIKYYDQKYGYDFADDFLDLTAVGIIGDVMNLTDLETRYILKEGLSHIKNFGLSHFLLKQSFSVSSVTNPTPTDISFYVTPLVNAIIRVGTMSEKETLFKAFISGPNDTEPSTKRGAKPGDLEVIADKAARIATNAKNHQNKAKDESVEMIKMKIEKEELNDNKVLLIALDEMEAKYVNPNLTGLIAMKLCQEYQKPTIVLREGNDEVFKGSFRVNNNSPLTNFKDFCNESQLIDYAEGHQSAAGIGISFKNLSQFVRYANKKLKDVDLGETSYFIDFYFSANDLDELKEACIDLAPVSTLYGKGLEEPKIVADKILFSEKDIMIMGKDKSSIKLQKDGISFVKFKDKDFIEKISKYSSPCVTIYGKFNLNEFAGKVTPQVIIEDYEITNGKTVF